MATISSDFKLGNLEVEVEDAFFEVYDGTFYLQGFLVITQVWSVGLDLGSEEGSGLAIDVSGHTPKFELDDFAIEVDNVGVGNIDINQLRIEFSDNTISEAIADIHFPMDWEVAADLSFVGNPARLDGIDISWEATSLSSVIKIGATGVSVIRIQGSLQNLTNDHVTLTDNLYWYSHGQAHAMPQVTTTDNMYFSGSMDLVYGGPVSLAGHQASFLYNSNTVRISSFRLVC